MPTLRDNIKILFFNPDKLPLGERIKAVIKVLGLGVSVVTGILVSDYISKLIILPILSEIVPTFFGALVSGIMSCTFLY